MGNGFMGDVALVLEGGWPTLSRDLHSSFHNYGIQLLANVGRESCESRFCGWVTQFC